MASGQHRGRRAGGLVGSVAALVIGVGGASLSCTVAHAAVSARPIVSSLSVTTGPLQGGTSVAIAGQNFTSIVAVQFGAVKSRSVTVMSSRQLVVVAPASTTAGKVNVTVSTRSAGTSALTAADRFEYVAAPIVRSLSVTAGSTFGQTATTITGYNLRNVVAVTVGGTKAVSFTSIDPGTLTIRTAAHQAGSYDVIVTTRYGISRASSGSRFTFRTRTIFSGSGCCDTDIHYFTPPPSGIPWTVTYSYHCAPADPDWDENYTIDLSIAFNKAGYSVPSRIVNGLAGTSGSGSLRYTSGSATYFEAWTDNSDPYSTVCDWTVSIVG